MKFRKLFESLEDERDLLLAAGDYKCKLTQYDIEEAADWTMLLEYIKDSYTILKDEFGDNLKLWSFYEDDDSDVINGYKVWLKDGTKHIVEINNDRVGIVNESLTEETDTKFIIVAVTKEGTRLFYNSIDDNFVTSAKAATIYDEHDVAIDDWHKIEKTQFKRVFVPNYDPELFESVTTTNDTVELTENIEDGDDYRYTPFTDPEGPGFYSDDDCDTDYRYYVYDATDNVVSDGFMFDEDAIEWAQENNYPTVKIHNYYKDTDGSLEPDGDPEVIWRAE